MTSLGGGGLRIMTSDDMGGGEGVKKSKKSDDVICEQPLNKTDGFRRFTLFSSPFDSFSCRINIIRAKNIHFTQNSRF